MTPLVSVFVGILGSLIISGSTAFFIRKKTLAETENLGADSAATLSQAAATLIPLYDTWVKSMETRLVKAEAAALAALARESACLIRIEALQHQIDELRAHIEHPQIITTTTVATTESKPI